MKHSLKILLTALSLTASCMAAQANDAPLHQEITRNGTLPTTMANAQVFTGTALVDTPFAQGQMHGAYVTFMPGARTAWHIHPQGQLLIVTAGSGLTQEKGQPIQVIKAGDVIWCPPGVMHWHGGSYQTSMTHLAISESAPGEKVTWLDKVTDEEYNALRLN